MPIKNKNNDRFIINFVNILRVPLIKKKIKKGGYYKAERRSGGAAERRSGGAAERRSGGAAERRSGGAAERSKFKPSN